ncbi:helix-turn-helix domain-containing protein [Glycomyces harbinensis]|uniref:Helix-turn-helix domain-containing protein n=1 Tax=Glycomyces harbinensis TaxID=58114 RepID=A0A1G6UAV6_9ACTN|nr:helix-turn-helix domain-containing protein [Glycomyces harbinensis]SDD37715.1 Helix-turn-helix domain-containing protein [Glycomyces harbinensis]
MTAADPESMTIATTRQYRALGHPVRHRMLFALGKEPATLSRLAADLEISKGSASHHLKILREAGLVRLDHTRQVRGGTEQYFKRTAERIRYDTGETTKVVLAAVAEEILTDEGDPLVLLRNVRLSEAQAQRLRKTLEDMVHELPDEDGEARHGVLVGVYRPRSET